MPQALFLAAKVAIMCLSKRTLLPLEISTIQDCGGGRGRASTGRCFGRLRMPVESTTL